MGDVGVADDAVERNDLAVSQRQVGPRLLVGSQHAQFLDGPHAQRAVVAQPERAGEAETTNLAERVSEKARELLDRLEAWRDRIGAPVSSEPNPEYDAAAETAAIEARRNHTL